MNNLFSIKDQVVVMTGGTGVLGRCIAKYLALEGARMIILGRNEIRGKKIADDISAAGGDILFLKTDVLNKEILEDNYKAIIAKYGRIDTLINAAGGNMSGSNIQPDQTVFDLSIEEMEKVVELNLIGTVLPTQVFLKAMVLQKRGCIINFSSMSAFRPLTRVLGYSVAKASINSYTAYMATELATKFGEGLRVNAIAPGFFLTEQNRSLLTNEDGSHSDRAKRILQQTPFGRMGQPEELCGTIQYLMSNASKFVTGTVAVVDGGFNVFSL